jgi:hypothetical protein
VTRCFPTHHPYPEKLGARNRVEIATVVHTRSLIAALFRLIVAAAGTG